MAKGEGLDTFARDEVYRIEIKLEGALDEIKLLQNSNSDLRLRMEELDLEIRTLKSYVDVPRQYH